MKKKSEIYIELIKKEIAWSLEHPATNLSKDFQKGFGAGLKQAITIIEKIELILKS